MQHDLGPMKYDKLMKAFNRYDVDSDYESYRNILFEIFQEDNLFVLLRTMTLLSRPEHRVGFATDIDDFIKTIQNK